MSISEIINLLKSQTVIDNALGGIIASIAMQFINSLFTVNQIFARGVKPEARKAMEQAMTLALDKTLVWLTDDPIRLQHFATLFEKWLLREEVILELHQLIDPKPGVTLNLASLAAEFIEAGWSVDELDEPYTFDEIVHQLAANFATFAAKEPALQGQINIQLLHEKVRMAGPQTQAKLRKLDSHYWIRSLRNFFTEKQKGLAEALKMKEEDLAELLSPLSPLEVLVGERQIVLLGDPGSGKSTLTQRLAALLAAVGCGDSKIRAEVEETESEALAFLLAQIGANWLPIWIVLSRWAIHLPEDATGCADDLIQECLRQIGTVGSSPRLREHLDGRLQADPPTVLLLLDGLDEVTDDTKRATIMQSINHFHQSYGAVPMMVTCRIRPYQAWQKGRQSLALRPHTLAPLEAADIERFVARWYTELVRVRIYQPIISIAAQERLLTALRDPQRKELREMAMVPLLLTMMANVNYDSPLPNRRAQLYERFVKKLLYEWERLKQDDQASPTNLDTLLRQKNWDPNKLDSVLNELAWRVHNEAQNRDTVDIPQHLIEHILRRDPLGNDDPAKAKWAVEVLKLVADRYGLINLVDRDRDGAGIYKFPHRTFQEYLAARRLATGDSTIITSEIEEVLNQERWREAVLLAFGYLAHVQSQVDTPLAIFDEWLSSSPATEDEWARLLLIGEAYVNVIGEITLSQSVRPKRAAAVRKRLITQLTTAMQHPDLPPRQRLDAGLLLAELEEGPDDVDGLVPVNAIRSPSYKFRIGKYPVTNAQFRRFVGDGGYDDQQWWSEEGRHYKEQNQWEQPRYWNHHDRNRSSQPVVGVSWYEAEAYCNWPAAIWRADGTIEQMETVRLPTRAEWEAAARSKHGKEYPWGSDEFDPSRANTEESNLGQTSPVHMYPLGTAQVGKNEIWDLSGNVFEWSSDLDKDGDPYAKGGCYYFNKDYTKASAAGSWFNRRNWNDLNGFRVVVVPISR